MSFEALGQITDLKRQHLSVEEGCLVISTKRPSGQAWLPNAAKVNQYFKENISSLEAYLKKESVLLEVEIALFQELEQDDPKRIFQKHIQEKYQLDLSLIPPEMGTQDKQYLLQALIKLDKENGRQLLEVVCNNFVHDRDNFPKNTDPDFYYRLSLAMNRFRSADLSFNYVQSLAMKWNLQEVVFLLFPRSYYRGVWSFLKNCDEDTCESFFRFSLANPQSLNGFLRGAYKHLINKENLLFNRLVFRVLQYNMNPALLSKLPLPQTEAEAQVLEEVVGLFEYAPIEVLDKVSIEDLKRLVRLQDWFPGDLFALGQILNNKPEFVHRLREREPYLNWLKIRTEQLGIDQAEIEALLHLPNIDNKFIGTLLELLKHITNKNVSLKLLLKVIQLHDWSPDDLNNASRAINAMPNIVDRLKEGELYYNRLLIKAKQLGVNLDIFEDIPVPKSDGEYKILEECIQQMMPATLKGFKVFVEKNPNIYLYEKMLIWGGNAVHLIKKRYPRFFSFTNSEGDSSLSSKLRQVMLKMNRIELPIEKFGVDGSFISSIIEDPDSPEFLEWLILLEVAPENVLAIAHEYYKTKVEEREEFCRLVSKHIETLTTYFRGETLELVLAYYSFLDRMPRVICYFSKDFSFFNVAAFDVACFLLNTKIIPRLPIPKNEEEYGIVNYVLGAIKQREAQFVEGWVDLMPQMIKIPGFKVHSEMIENLPLMKEIVPRIQGLNLKNSPYFCENIIPFIKNNPDLAIQEAIDLCYGGQAAYNRIEQRYPLLFTNLTLQRKLKLQEEVRKIIQEAKSVSIPFFAENNQLIIKQLETDSFSINRLLFISVLKDIPDTQCLLLLIEAMAQLTPGKKVALLNAIVEMDAETRFKVIQKLYYFREESPYPDIKLLQKQLRVYESLEEEGFFANLNASDRYSILKLIDIGIPKEALKETLNDKHTFPQYEWAFEIFISLGVQSKECVTWFSRFGPLLEGANDTRKRAITLLLRHMNPSVDRIDEALALLNTQKLEKLLLENPDEKDFVEALFCEQILSASLPVLPESMSVEVPPCPLLPPVIKVTKEHRIFKGKTLEEKKVAIKLLIQCLGVNPFPNLRFFTSQLKMEITDYFLLLHTRMPIVKTKSLKSPPQFNLRTALESMDPTLYTKEVKENNQRLIDSVLARTDVKYQWHAFKPELYLQMEKLCEWVYYQMTTPEADRENCRATLKAISESVQGHCPSDWLQEFVFQYGEWCGSDDPKEIILVLEGNARLNVVNVIIEVLSKRLFSSGEAESFTGALEFLSGNHQRNRLLAWLKTRNVPGSELMNKSIDPHLPDDLNVGLRFHPTEEDVVELFDTLYTLPFLLRELDKAINSKTFLKRDILTEWLEESRLAVSHKVAEWSGEKATVLKNGPPVIEIKPTDLSAFFAANPTSVDSVDALKSVGTIKQFIQNHKNFPKEPLQAFLKNPQDPSVQKALQKAYNECEKRLEPKMRRDQLRRKLIPCRLEDDEIDDYLAGEITYKDLVDAGIESAQREDFAYSLLDENSGLFKTEALLVLLVEARLYFSKVV